MLECLPEKCCYSTSLPVDGPKLRKLSFVLQAGQPMHYTLPKYLCNQLSLYNLEIFSFVMTLPKGIALSKNGVI